MSVDGAGSAPGSAPAQVRAASETLLALYRAWYNLPARSTRPYVESLRAQLAHALRDSNVDAAATLRTFALALDRLPGTAQALGNTRSTLAAALKANAAWSTTERAAVADLAAATDPLLTALSAMFWQPSLLEATVETLRSRLDPPPDGQPSPLDEAAIAQARAAYAALDAESAAASADYAARLAAQTRALESLQAISQMRRIAWRELIAAKVTTKEQVVTRLGGGLSMPTPVKPAITPPTAAGATAAGATTAVAATAVAATAVALYSDIIFPRTVRRSTTVYEALIVRLTPTPQPDSVVSAEVSVPFVDAQKPELVEVLLTAPGFEERFDLWQRSIVVYSDRPSQPAVFLLRSGEVGDKRLTVDFYHGGRQIGSAAFQTTVGEATSPARAAPLGEGVEIGGFPADPPPPADLELRIVRGQAANTLTFTLHSARPEVGFHWTRAGSVELVAADPQQFLEYKFERLSQLAAEAGEALSPEQAQRAQEAIAAIGEELWDEVIPEEFKSGLWPEVRRLVQAGVVHSLIVTSDEPWIPWEMVKPYTIDVATDAGTPEPFWAETFQFTRWLAGRGSSARFGVVTARLVAPDLDLAWVDVEKKAFDDLAAHGVATAPPLRTRAEVAALLREGSANLVHFAAHGSFDAETPGRSRLTLEDGSITADDLSRSATEGLRRSRPLVFVNACSLGQLGLALTGVGGWAEKMVNIARVGGFIGTLWEVNDRLAAEFASYFYARLFDGDTLGAAFHAARLYVRTLDPANPTWLAYTLYGDPNAVVSAGA